jgi:putative ABC transport system ATP-binding protein
MSGLAVSVRGVDKGFGKGEARVVALRGADLDARAGEMLMIVGPSGCGKTTLLSCIAGTLRVDGGEVEVFGQMLSAMSPGKVTRFRAENLGFIFQQFHLIPTLTVRENAGVPLLIRGVPFREAMRRADAMLERVGLGGRGGSRPNQLSGGQQQRVAIARALVHEPRLVICDEPTSALDRDTGHAVMELLRDVARSERRCVLVVTHDSRIYEFADRIAEMEDGRVIRIGTVREGMNTE